MGLLVAGGCYLLEAIIMPGYEIYTYPGMPMVSRIRGQIKMAKFALEKSHSRYDLGGGMAPEVIAS